MGGGRPNDGTTGRRTMDGGRPDDEWRKTGRRDDQAMGGGRRDDGTAGRWTVDSWGGQLGEEEIWTGRGMGMACRVLDGSCWKGQIDRGGTEWFGWRVRLTDRQTDRQKQGQTWSGRTDIIDGTHGQRWAATRGNRLAVNMNTAVSTCVIPANRCRVLTSCVLASHFLAVPCGTSDATTVLFSHSNGNQVPRNC